MESKKEIHKWINKILINFKNSEIGYEYNNKIGTHYIRISPESLFENEEFLDEYISFTNYFEYCFENEDLIIDSIFYGIEFNNNYFSIPNYGNYNFHNFFKNKISYKKVSTSILKKSLVLNISEPRMEDKNHIEIDSQQNGIAA